MYLSATMIGFIYMYYIFQSLGHDDFASIIKRKVATFSWHTAHGTSSFKKKISVGKLIIASAVGLNKLNLDL